MLYKDPEGISVFAAHDKKLEVRSTCIAQVERQDSSDVKQKIKSLENDLTDLDVSDFKPYLSLSVCIKSSRFPIRVSVKVLEWT